LPLFFEQTATLLDYLPTNAIIVCDAALPAALEKAWSGVATRYEDRRHDIERPVLPPMELFVEPSELEAKLENFSSVTLEAFKADTTLGGTGTAQLPDGGPARAARRCAGGRAPGCIGWLSHGVRRPRADRCRLARQAGSAARPAARTRPQRRAGARLGGICRRQLSPRTDRRNGSRRPDTHRAAHRDHLGGP